MAEPQQLNLIAFFSQNPLFFIFHEPDNTFFVFDYLLLNPISTNISEKKTFGRRRPIKGQHSHFEQCLNGSISQRSGIGTQSLAPSFGRGVQYQIGVSELWPVEGGFQPPSWAVFFFFKGCFLRENLGKKFDASVIS